MAGRFVSCTQVAQASIRVTGPASATGQAVGTAAALSIKSGVITRRLDVGVLQHELESTFLGAFAHGGVVFCAAG